MWRKKTAFVASVSTEPERPPRGPWCLAEPLPVGNREPAQVRVAGPVGHLCHGQTVPLRQQQVPCVTQPDALKVLKRSTAVFLPELQLKVPGRGSCVGTDIQKTDVVGKTLADQADRTLQDGR